MSTKMADRCDMCKRKAHLVLKCKCEKFYCITHLDFEEHKCSFDYKKEAKEQLIKQNPLIKSKKIDSF